MYDCFIVCHLTNIYNINHIHLKSNCAVLHILRNLFFSFILSTFFFSELRFAPDDDLISVHTYHTDEPHKFFKVAKTPIAFISKKKIEFEKYVASTKSVCSWCALYSIPIKMRIVQCFRYLFCSYYNSIIWLDLSMFSFSRCHFQTHFCSFSFLFCYLSIVFKSLACCAQIHWKWNSTCKPIQCGWNSKIKNWIANEKKKIVVFIVNTTTIRNDEKGRNKIYR